MTPGESTAPEPVRRVSVLGRLVPAFSYAVPAPACIVSALLVFGVMRAMRTAQTPGISAVTAGIAEANLPVRIALVFAIAVGLIAVGITIARLFETGLTAPPSAWFLVAAGCIGLAPLLALWRSESVLIEAILPRGSGIAVAASAIQRWLVATIVLGGIADTVLLIASIVPLPPALRAKRRYAPLLILLLMEVALAAMAVAFQTRTSWLQQLSFSRSF
jgi:hypothetical protein